MQILTYICYDFAIFIAIINSTFYPLLAFFPGLTAGGNARPPAGLGEASPQASG